MGPLLNRFSALGAVQLFALRYVAIMAGPAPGYFRAEVATHIEVQPGPTLGNYPNTSIPLSTDTTVTPDAGPTNTTSVSVCTSTNFKGQLEGYPAAGVVRVTDPHPTGTYAITVRAFNGASSSTTTTFTLTVTTPAACTPVSFAPAENFGVGTLPESVAVGDFNGDG